MFLLTCLAVTTAAAPARALPAEGGAAPLLDALQPLLPAEATAPSRRAARAGVTLAFAAPLRAARTAERSLAVVRLRLRGLAAALERQRDRAAAGPVHRELELRHLDLGDARALLARLATRLERTGTQLDPRVGQAGLRTALALEEILRTAQADLEAMGRAIRRGSEVLRAGRRSVSRMLALVEAIQDEAALPSRERVRLGSRTGSAQRLARGLRILEQHLEGPSKELKRVRSLLRVRWTGVLEAGRNLARGVRRRPPALVGGAELAGRLEGLLDTVRREFKGLATEAEALEEGRRVVPDLPRLPDWLFTRPEEASLAQAPVREPEARAEVLALLDEIEQDLERDSMVYDDPLTATLASTFRQRHELPESPGEAEILVASDPAALDALEALLDEAGADNGSTSEPKDGILVVGP
jgi:hypothetical protein